MSSVPERSNIDEEYKWDLESIYTSDQEWEDAFETTQQQVQSLESMADDPLTDAETLLTVLERRDRLMRRVSTVLSYARMRRDEDTREERYQALTARAQSLAADARSASSFIEPGLQELTMETFREMANEEPDLSMYDHYVEDVLRKKPHTRSQEVEELLADLSDVLGGTGEVYSMLSDADMTFPSVSDPDDEEVEITQSNFTTLLKRPDREFRRRVYSAYFDEWESVRHSVATAYAKSVKTNVKLATARNYDSARAAALDGPNVPESVYETLIDTVRSNIDSLHRYTRLKATALSVEPLQMWDLYMPLTDESGLEIPYERAKEHVIDSLEPIGDSYRDRVAEGFDARWIDVYENQGKRSGAYSGGTYDTQPFILMNYQDNVSSMYTLAHELGHSMHSELATEAQPYIYSRYEIFIAEIASTVNEALLTEHLLDTVEDADFRRQILNEFLERIRSTLFRQTLFAEFEDQVHQLEASGEALTADRLDDLYRELKSTYYAPAGIDDRIEREWMRIPHFYRAFYVYQYSTGIAAALAIADRIRSEGETAAAEYRDFLSRGSSEYPLELLEIAGIDMTSARPIERAIETFDSRLSDFEELL